MTLRAVIFDIYKTLLEVGPAPADREERWDALLAAHRVARRVSLAEFLTASEQVIAREHERARAEGIMWPEIFWPDVAAEVMPELRELDAIRRDEFLLRQQGLLRTTRLAAGVGPVLAELNRRGVVLGIASNAQPYTWSEVDAALETVDLDRTLFAADASFWSFEHGFSKPDPHVFRLLTARMKVRGISGSEILMVGDRLDNDIEPARAQGWQTWRMTAESHAVSEGDWPALENFLKRSS